MRILISGFAPFGEHTINPTALLVEALKNNEISYPKNLSVDQILLPVTFADAFNVLQHKINTFNPDVVVCFGLAAKREQIEIENLAVNKIHADIKDNAGAEPKEEMINHLGEASYLSTLPIHGIEGALTQAGIPVKISNDAGTFVCNYVFYRLMEANQDTLRLCGFIHVPNLAVEELKQATSVILNYIDY